MLSADVRGILRKSAASAASGWSATVPGAREAQRAFLVPPESAEETPRLYRTQMALYRAALQHIYPGKRIDCALVWTDGARLMPLSAGLLDAEIARITAAGSTDSAA